MQYKYLYQNKQIMYGKDLVPALICIQERDYEQRDATV